MRGNYPDGVTRQDVLDALHAYDTGVAHEFALSTDYDLCLPNGRRYPPKAIAGIAARRAAGHILTPADFSAGEDQKCFRVLRDLGFVIERKPAASSPKPAHEDWSDDELRTTVEAYLQMLRHEQEDTAYSKTAFNEKLRRESLPKRNKGAVEYRMQNISAVLEEIGHPWIAGYKPQRNVGSGVKERLLRLLVEAKPNEFTPFIHTDDLREVSRRTNVLLKSKPLPPPAGVEKPQSVERAVRQYERSPAVQAFVRREADGVCELCREPAPFLDGDGVPFLEVHHVVPLAEGGPDTVQNAAALCPNCHRRLHFGHDGQQARARLQEQVQRLSKSISATARHTL